MQSAVVIAMHMVDLADAIDLSQVEALWGLQQRPASVRSKLSSTPPKALAFGVPPVLLTLDPIDVSLLNTSYRAQIYVRLYEFGAAAFSLHVPVSACAWAAFSQLVNEVDGLGIAGMQAPRLWSMRREMLTPAYTTRWSELARVKRNKARHSNQRGACLLDERINRFKSSANAHETQAIDARYVSIDHL